MFPNDPLVDIPLGGHMRKAKLFGFYVLVFVVERIIRILFPPLAVSDLLIFARVDTSVV